MYFPSSILGNEKPAIYMAGLPFRRHHQHRGRALLSPPLSSRPWHGRRSSSPQLSPSTALVEGHAHGHPGDRRLQPAIEILRYVEYFLEHAGLLLDRGSPSSSPSSGLADGVRGMDAWSSRRKAGRGCSGPWPSGRQRRRRGGAAAPSEATAPEPVETPEPARERRGPDARRSTLLIAVARRTRRARPALAPAEATTRRLTTTSAASSSSIVHGLLQGNRLALGRPRDPRRGDEHLYVGMRRGEVFRRLRQRLLEAGNRKGEEVVGLGGRGLSHRVASPHDEVAPGHRRGGAKPIHRPPHPGARPRTLAALIVRWLTRPWSPSATATWLAGRTTIRRFGSTPTLWVRTCGFSTRARCTIRARRRASARAG